MAARYPVPGCVVEFLEGNAARTALVLEESGDRLRLLLPGRREIKLGASRLLPWLGPVHPANLGRDEAAAILAAHKEKREALAMDVPVLEAWEMAQGELEQAPAAWFAELFDSAPDADTVAAWGRALLACKSHFRFQPPEFLVFDAEQAEKRLQEQKAREEREAIASDGAAFLRLLWNVAARKASLAEGGCAPEVADRLCRMLWERVRDPETRNDEAVWAILAKGLPDVPHLPLQLLIAWGKAPAHYNFWLDRADYARGDDWWRGGESGAEAERLADIGRCVAEPFALEPAGGSFISIDNASTRDVDDAFDIVRESGGYRLTVALAAPALGWLFGGPLDRLVIRRATSIYLPEGDCHMLPRMLGQDSFSLLAGQKRQAFILDMLFDGDGALKSFSPSFRSTALEANLNYAAVQAALDAARQGDGGAPENAAWPYREKLGLALELAKKLEARRIAAGAVIMQRPEAVIRLEGDGQDVRVLLEEEPPCADAHLIVNEMMVASSAALAEWGHENNVPLLHRTQDVAVPREYAGIWSRPEDLARIMRALIPSSLDVSARPHAALAQRRYAPVTSPLRRYPDLVNEAQALAFLREGRPVFDAEGLEAVLRAIAPALEGAGHAQRFRPRYWKLLHVRQQGALHWWNGVITDENDNFVTVSLPAEGLFVRGRRAQFGERCSPGMAVRLRLGKVNPLYNEIQIMEAEPAE